MQSKSHIDVVTVTAQSSSAVARSHIAASWRRSLVNYGLDPGDRAAIARLDAASLRRRHDQIGAFRAVAEPELDRLFQLIGNSGSGLLLTDRDGVILDHRCKMADDDALSDIGLLPGAILNEKSEGTNGMGTCIAEERPVIVHREDHFMARSTAFTCIAVPVFGARGELIAVLDVSSACEDNSRSSSILLADVLMRSSRRIEATYFRDRYPGARIVMAETTRMDGSALLAVDADDLVVGATRAARQVDDAGAVLPEGEIGHIAIRTSKSWPAGLFRGYLKNGELITDAFGNGWYYTGDTASRDADGYLWFEGRSDDLISSAGYRISPFEVESALLEHELIAECAVIGVPDETRGQLVKAYIVVANGAEGSDDLASNIQTFCKDLTAPYKYPREIEFVTSLPKTISGKIRRVELRDAAS